MTENELVQRCRDGDRNAQRELYVRTRERIYGLVCRMCGNAEDAFDVAQNTYVRAFTHISQFDGRSSLATWLYRIAVTEALQLLRRRKRVQATVRPNLADSTSPHNGDGHLVAMDVNDALDTLDEVDRTVLLLRHREGLDYRTIAGIMECAEGTVASRLHRAREQLRLKLGDGYAAMEETRPVQHPIKRVRG